MKVDGTYYRSVRVSPADGWRGHIFDQTKLPWALEILDLTTIDQAAHAIRRMQTRGRPADRRGGRLWAVPRLAGRCIAERVNDFDTSGVDI